MKFLKTYEENKNEPQVGDYVLCEYPVKISSFKHIYKFLENNIGQIKEIDSLSTKNSVSYTIFFEKDLPYDSDIKNKKRIVLNKKSILHWSKNKEDLELLLVTDKYNL